VDKAFKLLPRMNSGASVGKMACGPFTDKGDGVLGTQWIDLTSLPSGSSRIALH
jgi:hypothetical protein